MRLNRAQGTLAGAQRGEGCGGRRTRLESRAFCTVAAAARHRPPAEAPPPGGCTMAPAAAAAAPARRYSSIRPVEMQSVGEKPLMPPGICPCSFMSRRSAPATFPDSSVLK